MTRNTYHIKDIVYGATDGIITTFAVVAGVVGGELATTTILVVGFANLLADGFSMAASNYLGTKSEHEATVRDGADCVPECHFPVRSGLYTFISFVVAGLVPLVPYIIFFGGPGTLRYTVLATAIALFLVGSLRTLVTGKNPFRSGFEILVIGGVAASIAFFVGWFINSLLT